MYAILLALLLQEADFRQAFLEPVAAASSDERRSLLDYSVVVTIQDKTRKVRGWGSGVLTKNGVLTCEHLFTGITPDAKIICTYKDQDVLVSIEKSDGLKDLALLRLPEGIANWPCAQVSEKPAFTGESLRSCGRGVSGLLTVESHKVIRLYDGDHRRDVEYTNAPVSGRSGSGLFNAAGDVVGIVRAEMYVAADAKAEHFGSAVATDSEELRKFLEEKSPTPSPPKSPIGDSREIVVSTAEWCGFCHEMQNEIEALYKSGKGDPAYRFRFVDVTKNHPVIYDHEKKTYRQAALPLSQWTSMAGASLCHEGKIPISDLVRKIEFNDSTQQTQPQRRAR